MSTLTSEPASRVAARFVLSTLAGENPAQPPATPVPDTTPPKPRPRPRPRPRRRPVWLQPLIDQTPSGERRFNANMGMPVDWGKRGI